MSQRDPRSHPQPRGEEARRARSIDEFAVGDRVSVRRVFDDAAVRAFAELSGDFNELHVDDEYARRSRFGRRVVHGMLSASLFTRLIGMELPGRGTIYLSQQLRFTAPVYVGDEVEAVVEVTAIDRDRRRMTLATTVTRADGQTAVTGEALVLVEGEPG
ncbi:MAG TPA: MaoC family dehydratase [Chloroflexota bacterium]|nr:MaoC family dehydratase [Chloroflexota bacterium]